MKNKNNIMIITAVIVSLLAVIAVVLVTGFMSSANGGESVISVNPPPVEISSETPAVESVPEVSEPTPESSDSSQASGDGIGQKVADSASALIGTPFAENGATPEGFDNSGFIYYVLRENGYITCPRTTEAQSVMGAKISYYDEMKPGDLMFFGIDDASEAAYGGIFIGKGKMIACLSTSMEVCEVDVTTKYYTSRFCGAISIS